MLIEHAGKALSVMVHPTRDIALIDHDSGGSHQISPSVSLLSFLLPTKCSEWLAQVVPPPLNRWNKVDVPLGRVAEGKRVTRINVGYDQPANTGGYRGYVDDISFYYACSAVPGTVEKCTNGVVRPLRDGVPSTAKSVAVPRELSESAPGGDVSHLIENYRYPNADQVLAEHNVRLISGDGLIVMASCDDPPLQDIGVIRVYTSDISVNNGGQVCFKVLGSSRGLLTMEVPNVFEIRGDGQRPGAGHKVTATIKPEDGPQDTVVVDPDGSTQVGIGTAPPGPPTTLLELRVTS